MPQRHWDVAFSCQGNELLGFGVSHYGTWLESCYEGVHCTSGAGTRLSLTVVRAMRAMKAKLLIKQEIKDRVRGFELSHVCIKLSETKYTPG